MLDHSERPQELCSCQRSAETTTNHLTNLERLVGLDRLPECWSYRTVRLGQFFASTFSPNPAVVFGFLDKDLNQGWNNFCPHSIRIERYQRRASSIRILGFRSRTC